MKYLKEELAFRKSINKVWGTLEFGAWEIHQQIHTPWLAETRIEFWAGDRVMGFIIVQVVSIRPGNWSYPGTMYTGRRNSPGRALRKTNNKGTGRKEERGKSQSKVGEKWGEQISYDSRMRWYSKIPVRSSTTDWEMSCRENLTCAIEG